MHGDSAGGPPPTVLMTDCYNCGTAGMPAMRNMKCVSCGNSVCRTCCAEHGIWEAGRRTHIACFVCKEAEALLGRGVQIACEVCAKRRDYELVKECEDHHCLVCDGCLEPAPYAEGEGELWCKHCAGFQAERRENHRRWHSDINGQRWSTNAQGGDRRWESDGHHEETFPWAVQRQACLCLRAMKYSLHSLADVAGGTKMMKPPELVQLTPSENRPTQRRIQMQSCIDCLGRFTWKDMVHCHCRWDVEGVLEECRNSICRQCATWEVGPESDDEATLMCQECKRKVELKMREDLARLTD